jgi:hypothetical protein
MDQYWHDFDVRARAGTELYNAFTNSRDDKIAGALDAAGLPIEAFVGVPSLSGAVLKAEGRAIDASNLKKKMT